MQPVALVTGGSRGIGREIAKLLAEQGNNVAVVSRNRESAICSANQLPSTRSGQRHLGTECDVSDIKSFGGLISDVEQKLGPITVLVNAAGILHILLCEQFHGSNLCLVVCFC